jgi:hypothetical protein
VRTDIVCRQYSNLLEVVAVDERLPALLTVEEAGGVLRIGRTKAYAMAREWRATGGRSGLPVIDLGHVLRVPRRALEELIGASLEDSVGTGARTADGGETGGSGAAQNGPVLPAVVANRASTTRSTTTRPQSRYRRDDATSQPNLFDSSPPS